MTTSLIICIYHDNCADGFGAAWVVRKALGADIEFYAAKHGDLPPDVTGKHVFIVDFSYSRETLIKMAATAQSVVVLDHHKTAQAELCDLPAVANVTAIFDMKRSGAGMAWDYFFPRHPRPALIGHIEDRDLWRFQLEGTREVMASIFSYPFDFDVWDALFTADIEQLRAEGLALERKQQKDVAQLVRVSKQRMTIGGFDVPAANLPPTLASDAGNLMCTGEPFAAVYWDIADGRVFSLRSTDLGEDVSAIAKQYGGGGHRNASGFKVLNSQTRTSSLRPSTNSPDMASKVIEWLNARGDFCAGQEYSIIKFPHTPQSDTYEHAQEALIEAFIQDNGGGI